MFIMYSPKSYFSFIILYVVLLFFILISLLYILIPLFCIVVYPDIIYL